MMDKDKVAIDELKNSIKLFNESLRRVRKVGLKIKLMCGNHISIQTTDYISILEIKRVIEYDPSNLFEEGLE